MASWETGMKVDPVAYASFGFYSEVYGVGEEANIANLFVSTGMFEDAPVGGEPPPLSTNRGLNRLGLSIRMD